MKGRRILRALVWASSALACAFAGAGCRGPSPFRVVETADEGRLETEWIEFAPPAGRPAVKLLNMAHFGEPEFYAATQAELDRAGVVLMEGVKPSPARLVGATSRAAAGREYERSYAGAAGELRLATQAASLVPGPHWRNADLTEREVVKSPLFVRMAEGADALPKALAEIVAEEVARLRGVRPDLSDAELETFVREGPLRRETARMLESSRMPEDEILIVARNEAALEALRETPASAGPVVLCFGAAHGEHFVRRLRQLGYDPLAIRRAVVFRYRLRPPGGAPRRRRAA